ncbi:MAG: leucine-rich repeat domain-containing protein, partial [Eubacterium sp.]|nr:leucine-rich repeat domain-containing protein [Eubacterium sp.]
MKRISSFLLAVIMVISILGSVTIAYADTWEAGETITVTISKNVLSVKGTGDMYDYSKSNLPPWGSFKGDITEVVIEEGVTSIGNYALSNLIAAENVTIPNTVKRIGERAFSGSYSIKSINIPASVEEIGDNALTTAMNEASFLAEITVDSDNKYFTVEDGILYNSIKTILYKVPSKLGVEVLDVIPTVITIKSGAVVACSKLTEVNLPESVIAVGEKAFDYCTKLKKVVVNSRECELALASIPNNSGLKLYGYSGTNVELYAKNNGYTNIEFVPLNDEHTHIWDNAKVTKPATTSADGTKTYTCTKCGETKTETIAK